jgi:hypothetical protein
MIARFTGALVRALPQLPREVVLWRAFFTMGAMHHLLCSPGKADLLSKGLRSATTNNEMTEYLVEFSVAGMCASVRTNPTRRPRSKKAIRGKKNA